MANGNISSMNIRVFPQSTLQLRLMGITQIGPNRCLRMQSFAFYERHPDFRKLNSFIREVSMPATKGDIVSVFLG